MATAVLKRVSPGATADSDPNRRKRVRIVPWSALRKLPTPKVSTANAFLSLWSMQNGREHEKQEEIPLWVYDISADFSLTGSTAQSAAKRDFYPRNFSQPTYSITGQAWNEFQYGQMMESIKDWQNACVFQNYLMRFSLPKGGTGAWTRMIERKGKNRRQDRVIKRNLKGEHARLDMMGYIMNAPRRHARFTHAPEYTLAFIVSRSKSGPFLDEAIAPHVLPTDWDSFVARDAAGFVRDPDQILLSQRRQSKGGKQVESPREAENPDGTYSLVPRNPDGTPG